MSQEAVAELERNKAELAQSIQRKEREFSAIMAKIEDEASLGGKQQKQIKELTVRFFYKSYFLMSNFNVSEFPIFFRIELRNWMRSWNWNVGHEAKLKKADKSSPESWRTLRPSWKSPEMPRPPK